MAVQRCAVIIFYRDRDEISRCYMKGQDMPR